MSATRCSSGHEEVLPWPWSDRGHGRVGRADPLRPCVQRDAAEEYWRSWPSREPSSSRHIAYDIGAAAVTRALARRLGAPAILTRFSRLLIDPNRGRDDPTLVMRLSDGAVVPGNAGASTRRRSQRRIARFYDPYDAAIRHAIDRALAPAIRRSIVAVHSFTPFWRGWPAALACGDPVGSRRPLRPAAPRRAGGRARARRRRQRAL